MIDPSRVLIGTIGESGHGRTVDWAPAAHEKVPRSGAQDTTRSTLTNRTDGTSAPFDETAHFPFNLPMNVLISAQRIRDRVDELGAEIAADFHGKKLTVVGVLTGCLVFLADLIRRLNHPLQVALIEASSYRGTATSAGQLEIHDELLTDIAGRHILLIDDILDTGNTASKIVEHLKTKGAASIRTCTLLRKIGRQQVAFEPDYVGFEIPDKFVIGYGLDFNDEYRHLPFIAELPSDQIPPHA